MLVVVVAVVVQVEGTSQGYGTFGNTWLNNFEILNLQFNNNLIEINLNIYWFLSFWKQIKYIHILTTMRKLLKWNENKSEKMYYQHHPRNKTRKTIKHYYEIMKKILVIKLWKLDITLSCQLIKMQMRTPI